jgi:hypothetical protein
MCNETEITELDLFIMQAIVNQKPDLLVSRANKFLGGSI